MADPSSSRAGRWLKEPLLWFLALGALLFWVDRDGDAEQTVILDQAIIARLTDQWQAQMGRPPNDSELAGLTDDWLKEEIYSREAAAMGLDKNDTIIRRRLVQKLKFLTEDLAVAGEPSDTELAAFYATHAADYREPARYDFEHRYFSADRREDPAGDAATALESIASNALPPAEVGDPFLLQSAFAARSVRQVGDLFGRAFATALPALPADTWQGPVPSAYGQHLVRVLRVVPGYQPPLAEVRNRVLADYARDLREQANAAYYGSLQSRYRVLRSE